jgi:hypothetical protein
VSPPIYKSSANLSFTTGTASVSNLQPFTYPYSFNGSAYFDGAGDYLSIADNSVFRIVNDFTFEAWVYQTSPKLVTVIGQWPNPGTTSFIFRIENTGRLSFAYNTSSESNGSASTSRIAYNTWNHVVWTRSGTTFKYFINGVQDATTVSLSGAFADSAGPVLIGLYNTSVDTYFNGYISNARFINGTAVYAENFTPPTEPLTAIPNTVLLTLQNNVPANNRAFRDTSNSGAIITPVGSVTQGTFGPHGTGWSGCFEGVQPYLRLPPTSGIFNFGTNDFTIEAWIYPTALAGFQQIAGATYSASGAALYLSGTSLTLYSTGAHSNLNKTPDGSILQNVWQHVAAVRSSGILKLYINGVERSSVAFTAD